MTPHRGETAGSEEDFNNILQTNNVHVDNGRDCLESIQSRPRVRYEIMLHPTYQVPCLWFNLQNLPADEEPLSIDTVFRWLVPDEYKGALRASVGRIGGISLDVRLAP